jgi:hypothetical protein
MLGNKRLLYAVWLLPICAFSVLHALNLRADFPNHTPWYMDWAKYTDEGWYGNAAVRAHLFGNWYLPGDFNPAAAAPVWPFLEWLLFFVTGVTVQAARGLAVAAFFASLALSYLLLRSRGPVWMALLAVTLLATSPFVYCFSRLAILEPALIMLMLAALNVAVRLPALRRPLTASAAIGVMFTLMLLTKATAVFLAPALAWAMILPLLPKRALLARCCGVAAAGCALSLGLWMALVVRLGLLADFKYLFMVNSYPRPTTLDWPLISLWWSFHGGLWVDHILIPLAGMVVLGALLAWRSRWARALLIDPVFGASVLAVAGYIVFMTYQDHPQPRYFAVVVFFCFFIVAQGAHRMLAAGKRMDSEQERQHLSVSLAGWLFLGVVAVAVGTNGAITASYAAHPEYTFVNAAERLTRYRTPMANAFCCR